MRRFLPAPVASLLASRLAPPAALCIIGACLYGGTVGHELTTWDDDVYVTRNPIVTHPSWDAVVAALVRPAFYNYHPLTMLTYMAEYAVAGNAAWIYHLDNVLLHLAATVLAYAIARRWLGRARPRWQAFLVALLFLAHPLRVESVAWVAERKDVLCGVFYLAALLAYTLHLDPAEGHQRRWEAATWVFFVLALLSKVMAITLPAALAIVLAARGALTRSMLLRLAPMAVVAAAFAVVGVAAQAQGGGVKTLHGGDLWSHGLTICKAVSIYAEKLVMPLLLSPRYMVTPAASLLEARVLAGLLLIGLGVAAIWVSLRGDRRVALGLGMFAVAWAPVSGVAPSSTLVADRYLYLPALGLFLGLVAWIGSPGSAPRTWRPPGVSWRRVTLGVVVLHVLASLVLTPRRAAAWQTSTTLWTAALEENPNNPFAYNQLSLASLEAGRPGEAAALAALAGRHGLGGAEYALNLAFAYRSMGDRTREANTARSIAEAYPDCVAAWLVILRQQIEARELEAAADLLDRLAARHGEDPALVYALGRLEEERGNLQAGLAFVLRSITLQPRQVEALLGASVILAKLGDSERALANAERAINLPGATLHPGVRDHLVRLLHVVREHAAAEPRAANAVERALALSQRAQCLVP